MVVAEKPFDARLTDANYGIEKPLAPSRLCQEARREVGHSCHRPRKWTNGWKCIENHGNPLGFRGNRRFAAFLKKPGDAVRAGDCRCLRGLGAAFDLSVTVSGLKSMDLAQNAPKQVEKACQVDAESLDQAFQEWLPAPQAANLAPWPLCGTGFLL